MLFSAVTRRKKKHLNRRAEWDRTARVNKLLAVGWIKSAAEIPSDAIPVDPDRLNVGGLDRPTHYRDLEFTCRDCGAPQTWKAEDQLWYYETTGAPFFSTAVRCRACRKKEQQRKALARISAGHATPQA
jgi:hypothetical protein